ELQMSEEKRDLAQDALGGARERWTRREVLAGAGAVAGIAVAARWAGAAEAIHTPDTGLNTGTTKVPLKGGEMPAYYARPDGDGPFPVVLVAHEIFGVHEYIRDVCRRLAKLGVLAVAPDLFFRYGDAAQAPSVDDILKTIVSRVSDDEVMTGLDATLAWTRG